MKIRAKSKRKALTGKRAGLDLSGACQGRQKRGIGPRLTALGPALVGKFAVTREEERAMNKLEAPMGNSG